MSAVVLPVVLSIGSNLGDREATLRAAVRDIDAIDGVVVTAASSLVETPALKPDGVDTDAPAYLNAAVLVRSALDLPALLEQLQRVEHAHGRVRDVRWGDRTLDIDIVSAGQQTVALPGLSVPHPHAAVRAFVLAPWLELEPDAELVGRGPVAALLAALGDEVTGYDAEPLW